MKHQILICGDHTKTEAEAAGAEHHPSTQNAGLGIPTPQRRVIRSRVKPAGSLPRRTGTIPRWFAGSIAIALFGCGSSSETQFIGAGGSSGEICPAGQQQCGAACVDTLTDADNCGACGTACRVGQTCEAGACQCQAGLANCAGECVSTDSDGDHCGACNNACTAGQVCSSGVCAGSCGAGETACGTSCVDLTSNVSHCGGCNSACAGGQTCTDGACTCTTPGEIVCSGLCANTQTDPSNCGACAVLCAPGQSCVAGSCNDTGGGSVGTGGAATVGEATGGTVAVGEGTGGVATGSGGTGGVTGGEGTGGAATGGAATGGAATGGAATGGAATGGAATGGEATGGDATGGEGTGGDATGGEGTGGDATGGEGTGGEGTGGVPVSCSTPLADRVTVTNVSVSSSVDLGSGQMWGSTGLPVILATSPDGRAKVAWSDGSNVHVTPLDTADQRAGDDATVSGSEVRGFVAHNDGSAVLLVRGDAMILVRLDETGNTQWSVTITDEGDRWIDSWPHNGRLAWSGSEYGAYFGQTGNFGAQGDHQGDQYAIISADGSVMSGGWDWGCSHSLDVRIAHNGTAFAPICTSDTYPGAGIWFNNREEISSEPSIDNMGNGTKLGGLVPTSDGFLLTFTSPAGRSSYDVVFIHVGNDGTPSGRVYLTDTAGEDEYYSHLAAYGDGLLAGWGTDTSLTLATLDMSGNITEGPVAVSAQLCGLDDFASYPNGDVGWAFSDGDSTLQVARMAACE